MRILVSLTKGDGTHTKSVRVSRQMGGLAIHRVKSPRL